MYPERKRQKVVRSVRKWQNELNSGWKLLFCTNSCTLLKIANKWCAQCGNGKTFRFGAENAVLYKLVPFAENRQKVVYPVRKWQNVLISGWKRWFVQTCAFCWKSLKSGMLSGKMLISGWRRCLHKLVHFAKNGEKVVRPVRKWQNVLI